MRSRWLGLVLVLALMGCDDEEGGNGGPSGDTGDAGGDSAGDQGTDTLEDGSDEADTTAEVGDDTTLVIPEVPTGLAAEDTAEGVELTWDAVTNAEGYNIYRRTEGDPAEIDSSNTAAYSDADPPPNVTVYYAVSAFNEAGESDLSEEVSVDVGPAEVPGAPITVTITRGDRQLTLTWDADANADEWIVGRSLAEEGPYTDLEPTTEATLTDTGLENRTFYYYVVRGSNALGEGENSGAVGDYPYAANRELCIGTTPTVFKTLADHTDGVVVDHYGAALRALDNSQAIAVDPTRDEILFGDGALGMYGFPRDSGEFPTPSRFVQLWNGDRVLPFHATAESIDVDPRDGSFIAAGPGGVYSFESETAHQGATHVLNESAQAALLNTDADPETIIVLAMARDQVMTFARDAEGDDEPLTAFSTSPAFSAYDIAVDTENDEIWIAALLDGNEVLLAFDMSDDGTVTPNRTISLPTDDTMVDDSLVYDALRDQVLVMVQPLAGRVIRAYDRSESDPAETTRDIAVTTSFPGEGLAYDAEADELLVLASGEVEVFEGAADDDATALRSYGIPADAYTLRGLGIAYHPETDELWMGDYGQIEVFDANTSSDVPEREISASTTPAFNDGFVNTISFAPEAGEVIAMVNTETIVVFEDDADGDVSDPRVITDSADLLSDSYAIYDPENDLIVVASCDSDRVVAFARESEGPTAAEYTLTGSANMACPDGLAVLDDELFVGNYDTNTVEVYTWPQDDDTAEPLRTLQIGVLDGDGQFVEPDDSVVWGITIDPINRELLLGDGSGYAMIDQVRAYAIDATDEDEPLHTMRFSRMGNYTIGSITFCDGL